MIFMFWRGVCGNAVTSWNFHPNAVVLFYCLSLCCRPCLIPMPPIRTFRVITLDEQCRPPQKLHTAYDCVFGSSNFKRRFSLHLYSQHAYRALNDLMSNHENTHFAALSFEHFTFRCHTFPRPALPAQMLLLLLRNFLLRDLHPYSDVISAGSHQHF